MDGNVKFQFSSLLCVIFNLPLQIPLVASLNILGYYYTKLYPSNQERIKGTEKASSIHTLFHT